MAAPEHDGPVQQSAYKWLPITSESCVGCGHCVTACPHDCLEMIWDFAKLTKSEACVSEGACVQVCPSEAIKMGWLKSEGEEDVGFWSQQPPEQSTTNWFARVMILCRK